MKILLLQLILLLGSLTQVSADLIFFDSFESGDLSKTNGYGFKWSTPNRTSVVTMDPSCGNLNKGDATILFDGSPTCRGPYTNKNWQAYNGKNSLNFNYPANKGWTEQRFNTGTPLKEVWISFMLRVPDNFKYGPKGGPNKLFALWMDDYSQHGDGSTIWLTMWDNNSDNASVAFTYSRGGYTSSTSMRQYKPFITTDDRGKWMKIIIHAKTESSPGKSDGMIQTFRKWDDSPVLETIHDGKNLPIKIPTNGPSGFQRGYILGWANASYTDETDWLLDDFTLSASPLVRSPRAIESLNLN